MKSLLIEQSKLNEEFIEATRIGDFYKIKYLLTSDKIDIHADIAYRDYGGFINVCGLGHLDIIKFLLTSPELKHHADIHTKDDGGLYWASRMGHFEVVKYLLTSPDLKEHAFINASDDACFKIACEHNDKTLMNFLLKSDELKQKPNLSKALIYSCKYEQTEMIEFIIFDLNVKRNKEIDDYLITNDLSAIDNMFKIREINNQLNNELKNNLKDKKNTLKV